MGTVRFAESRTAAVTSNSEGRGRQHRRRQFPVTPTRSSPCETFNLALHHRQQGVGRRRIGARSPKRGTPRRPLPFNADQETAATGGWNAESGGKWPCPRDLRAAGTAAKAAG